MKEFDERWKSNCELEVNCGDMKCRECKKILKTGWGAALKWTIKELRKHECIGASHWVGDFIEEELKDE